MSSSRNIILVKQKYRSLARLIELLPETKYRPEQTWNELRSKFRRPLSSEETFEQRILVADERISFLKMITPKTKPSVGHGGRWLYKDGKRLEGHSGGTVTRDQNGRVISNWDGKNLDPDSVKRHNYHLKRLGFRNNAHAKGIF
jgi:hypothetical protein